MAPVDSGLTIFPAIDLKGGQVVRLAEGDMARATVYGDDPAAQARIFADAGASHLHVVDLDGAFAGASVNGAAVESIIAAFPGKVQVGGGIRDRAGVDRWLALGVERVIIGTAALKDPEFVKSAARDLPGRIVAGVHEAARCSSPTSAATGCSRAAMSTRRLRWHKQSPFP